MSSNLDWAAWLAIGALFAWGLAGWIFAYLYERLCRKTLDLLEKR